MSVCKITIGCNRVDTLPKYCRFRCAFALLIGEEVGLANLFKCSGITDKTLYYLPQTIRFSRFSGVWNKIF
ncbi:hypothetical protein JCM10512_2148 [Bacteroides reticulotermitis JCM 10512]|uniref:Uncharacterized protein n=1 Tax=Bacteroides reticulotermitis JCM 10512 TaxID=1445607 RepID=W4URM1_9BACE|nr:hypothetical protein JCM10512_2148 [Bacteroides reticulotermitis JCM 10512]